MAMRACRSRRWKSGSMPPSFWDSSHTRPWMPATGFQCHFTSEVEPSAAVRRNVWTPKPSIVAYERGIARSDITHISMWVDSGWRPTKSQNVSWADWAWGISRSGSGFTAWIEVGELQAVLDEEDRDVVADEIEVALVGVELRREAADVAGGVRRAPRAGHRREPDEHRRARRPCAGSRPRRGPRARRWPRTTPWAPAPRAWTTRSGMRSWSKCMIFSRRWKSSSRVGPRSPAVSELSASSTRSALRGRQAVAGLRPRRGDGLGDGRGRLVDRRTRRPAQLGGGDRGGLRRGAGRLRGMRPGLRAGGHRSIGGPSAIAGGDLRLGRGASSSVSASSFLVGGCARADLPAAPSRRPQDDDPASIAAYPVHARPADARGSIAGVGSGGQARRDGTQARSTAGDRTKRGGALVPRVEEGSGEAILDAHAGRARRTRAPRDRGPRRRIGRRGARWRASWPWWVSASTWTSKNARTAGPMSSRAAARA